MKDSISANKIIENASCVSSNEDLEMNLFALDVIHDPKNSCISNELATINEYSPKSFGVIM